jgi:DNA-binding PadR family transcriptional regulator
VETVNEQYERIVIKKTQYAILRRFLDWLMLVKIYTNPQSGYDIQQSVLKRYHFLIPSGTIYAKLHSLEKQNLLQSFDAGFNLNSRRVYKLTPKGIDTVNIIARSYQIKTMLTTIYGVDCILVEKDIR